MEIAPTAYQVRVMQEAFALLGRREDAPNMGPLVRMLAEPFLPSRYLSMYLDEDGEKRGELAWCALYACYCWWKAWPGFRRYARSAVDDLWEATSAQQWAYLKSERAPAPADLVFFVRTGSSSRTGPHFRHVGLVVRYEADGVLRTIEGNAGDAVRERTYHLSDPQIFGFARPLPPPLAVVPPSP